MVKITILSERKREFFIFLLLCYLVPGQKKSKRKVKKIFKQTFRGNLKNGGK